MGVLTRRDAHRNILFEWKEQFEGTLSVGELKKYIFIPQNAFMPCGLCDQLNSFWIEHILNEFLLKKRADQEVLASANNFKQPISWRNQHHKHRKFQKQKKSQN